MLSVNQFIFPIPSIPATKFRRVSTFSVLASELASLGIESPDRVSGNRGLLRDAFDDLRSNLEQLQEDQAIASGKKEQLESELSHQTSLCEVSVRKGLSRCCSFEPGLVLGRV